MRAVYLHESQRNTEELTQMIRTTITLNAHCAYALERARIRIHAQCACQRPTRVSPRLPHSIRAQGLSTSLNAVLTS